MLQFDFSFLLKPKLIAEASRFSLISSKLQTLQETKGAPFKSAQERHRSKPK